MRTASARGRVCASVHGGAARARSRVAHAADALRDRAVELGWPAGAVSVVDEDLGRSGASTDGRLGFKELVAEVGLGHVGLVLALEVSRFVRSSADWHQLLELCALTAMLIADSDGIYSPADFNDRLLLGLKGTMSEAAPDPLAPGRRAAQQGQARRAGAEPARRP
jgi:DNA invertase Pin-like site-specific DNA recombinase